MAAFERLRSDPTREKCSRRNVLCVGLLDLLMIDVDISFHVGDPLDVIAYTRTHPVIGGALANGDHKMKFSEEGSAAASGRPATVLRGPRMDRKGAEISTVPKFAPRKE